MPWLSSSSGKCEFDSIYVKVSLTINTGSRNSKFKVQPSFKRNRQTCRYRKMVINFVILFEFWIELKKTSNRESGKIEVIWWSAAWWSIASLICFSCQSEATVLLFFYRYFFLSLLSFPILSNVHFNSVSIGSIVCCLNTILYYLESILLCIT